MDKQRFAEAYELNEEIGKINTFMDFVTNNNSNLTLVATSDNDNVNLQVDGKVALSIYEILREKTDKLNEEFDKI